MHSNKRPFVSFHERQGVVLYCVAEMRTTKRGSSNRTLRANRFFVPFRVRSHGASCKSFQNKPEDANASPNHVPISRKVAEICGCERS